MDTEELRAALVDAGLSQYQSEAYVAVLALGEAAAVEIADACSVPQARIYDVLRDLEEAGYVETYEQESLHARANDPAVVLDDLRDRAETFADAADEIEERWEQPAMDDHMVSIVKRFDTVLDRARAHLAAAENEIQLSATPDQFEQLRPALEEAHANDVVVNVSLHSMTPDAWPEDVEATYADVATEVRHRELPSPFLALVDRTRTCFAPHDQSVNDYGVLVDDYTLTYVFHWYFLTSLWEVWNQLYSGRPSEPPMEFTSIRQFVREFEPVLEAGATLDVRVRGYETESGEQSDLRGTVTGATYAGESPTAGDEIPLAQLSGQVTLHLDDGEREWSVGGWGAFVEDVEATRITVEGVDGRH